MFVNYRDVIEDFVCIYIYTNLNLLLHTIFNVYN